MHSPPRAGFFYGLRTRAEITWTFDALVSGALRRCEALVWLATRRAVRLASHPDPAAKCSSYFRTGPYSDAAAVDPEEMFVASLASCHMLWFLSLAAQRGWCVDAYTDDAVGTMARNAQGRLAITLVTLRPRVVFAGQQPGQPPPDNETLHALHHAAHEACFIANSVHSEVRCEPVHCAPPA